jgi:photosystem II stability/assembly factor-like uncharacterized protein
MKIFIVLSIATVMISGGCSNPAEPLTGKWTPVALLPPGSYYHEILFTNPSNGWVVGSSGRILHTSNAGDNWEIVESGTLQDLHCVAFVGDLTGWIGGRKNTILHTTDAGISWVVQNVVTDTLHGISSMCFVDAQTGWAVSNFGEILHTTDAGKAWSFQQSGTQWALTSVHFANATLGWAVSPNQIVCRTSDGGEHWESLQISSSSPGWYTDIKFIDEQRGWIATTVALSSSIQPGSPLLYTQDGGSNWNQQAVLPSLTLLSISVVYPSFAWVSGFDQIFQTSDGGISWVSQYRRDGEVFVSLSFIANNGWALSFVGTVLRYEL